MAGVQQSIDPDGLSLFTMVQRLARDLGFSPEAADDAVQQVWLALKAKGLHPATPRACAYARGVVRNLRKQSIRDQVRTRRAMAGYPKQERRCSGHNENSEVLHACQECWDIEERWAIERLFVHGSSYQELAEDTNRSVGWWHKRVTQALIRAFTKFDLPDSGARPGWRGHDVF